MAGEPNERDERAGPAETAPRRRRGLLRIVLEVLLTLLVTAFILRRIGVDLDALVGLDYGRWTPSAVPLIASVLVLVAGYVFSAALWGRMVRELGGPALGLRAAVPLFLVANLGRYVPGKVLQIAGLAWLARRRGVPATVAAGAAVLGQGVALLGATLLGLAAFFSPALDRSFRLWGWIGLAAVGSFLVLTTLPGPARILEGIWSRRVGETGIRPVVSGGFGIRWTTLYLLNWSLYAVAFWLFYIGLEGWAPFLYVGPAFAAAYVGGYLALFAPAGLGVREGLLAAFLAPVLPPEAALAVAVAARLWATGVEVVPAAALASRVLGPGRNEPLPDEDPRSTNLHASETVE